MSPIVLLGDIEKASLAIGLEESDRNVVKFLSVKNPLPPPIADNIVVYRFASIGGI